MEDIRYIHYWKMYATDIMIQSLLDIYKVNRERKKVWLILLEEKLRRAENEISIS